MCSRGGGWKIGPGGVDGLLRLVKEGRPSIVLGTVVSWIAGLGFLDRLPSLVVEYGVLGTSFVEIFDTFGNGDGSRLFNRPFSGLFVAGFALFILLGTV